MLRKTTLLLRAEGRHLATGRRLALPALAVAGATLVVLAAAPTADAKSPGSRYCFHGFCHRVGTLAQTDTLVGWRGYVQASYYDSCHLDRLNPCGLTSSGAVFRPDLADNAASPLLPDGTVILAYNPKTGDSSILRITNAGPYSGKRKLDVSRAAADKLGFRKQGVAGLIISVLQSPTKAEASYARKREYPAVPGHLGKFETFDAALEAAQARFDIRDGAGIFETASLGSDELASNGVPRPQLAVSPSLARELTMLRSPPRPVIRAQPFATAQLVQDPLPPEPQLVQGPRLVSRAAVKAEPSPAPETATLDFAAGFTRYWQSLFTPERTN